MNNIIDKTKKLIDSFENSNLIRKLDYYKEIVINNSELLELINKYNTSKDDYEKISLKTSKTWKMHKKFMVDIKIFYIYIFACEI